MASTPSSARFSSQQPFSKPRPQARHHRPRCRPACDQARIGD
jgi:hypothetical protein